jgi:hypothetical protein
MNMEGKRLALIVSYYLSRFDKDGLKKLGFSSFNEAFEIFANKLNVKKNYIKLSRDEFDPIFPWRRGWQRPMDKRIIKTIETFEDFNESDLRDILLNILNNHEYAISDEAKEIAGSLQTFSNVKTTKGKFILRAPTGRQAEEYFIEYYNQNFQPVKGLLRDTRDFGCGYDFEIHTGDNVYYIEVKGLTEISGGVLFTNKEWQTALTSENSYYLAIVRNLKNNARITFIQNPASVFRAKKNIYTSLQIQWSITEDELNNYGEKYI